MLQRVDPNTSILALAWYEHIGQRGPPFDTQGRGSPLNYAEQLGAIAVGAVGQSGVDSEEVGQIGGYRGGDGREICGLGRRWEAFVTLEDIANDTALGAGSERERWVRITGEGRGIGKGGCCGENERIRHFEIVMASAKLWSR